MKLTYIKIIILNNLIISLHHNTLNNITYIKLHLP